MKTKKPTGRKGAFTLGELPAIVLTLIFVATILVGGYLVLDGLGTAATDGNDSSTSQAEAAVNNMTASFDNVVTYAPTWGTILGVSILIGIVVFGFAFARQKNML